MGRAPGRGLCIRRCCTLPDPAELLALLVPVIQDQSKCVGTRFAKRVWAGRAFLREIYGLRAASCTDFHANLDRATVKKSGWFWIFEVDYQHILLVDSIANLL
jgi:hypothetical protein